MDRIAISVHCLRKKPKDLFTFFEKLIKESVEHAEIQAVALTGLTLTSVDLFEAFINKKKDNGLEAVALSMVFCSDSKVLESSKVKYWIER